MEEEKQKEKIENFFTRSKEIEVEKKDSAEITPESGWKSKFKFNPKKILVIAGILVVAGLLGTSGYFYWQYKKVVKNQSAVSTDEIKEITGKIEKVMELPQEKPTMATVADREKLKDQIFFEKAENGDKVLIYSQSGKVILWRPSIEKIVEITSLNKGQANLSEQSIENTAGAPETQNTAPAQEAPSAEAQNNQAQPAEAPKTARVAVYNGTNQRGLAKSIADKLEVISEANVISTENAKGNYVKTVVIDLIGNNTEIAKKIAETIAGEVGSLPANEIKPDADILVIGGSE